MGQYSLKVTRADGPRVLFRMGSFETAGLFPIESPLRALPDSQACKVESWLPPPCIANTDSCITFSGPGWDDRNIAVWEETLVAPSEKC